MAEEESVVISQAADALDAATRMAALMPHSDLLAAEAGAAAGAEAAPALEAAAADDGLDDPVGAP